mmetsp:Transcript_26146/g.40531  ORF Transcript_26146/g.40531 Transcript_26146/m.40531 type:complete len:256 (+) Transcript_26146:136-903(+)
MFGLISSLIIGTSALHECSAFTRQTLSPRHNNSIISATTRENGRDDTTNIDRRNFFGKMPAALALTQGLLISAVAPPDASALVEGYAPPSKSKSLPEEYRQGTLTLSDTDDNAVVPATAYKKLDSGVTYADLRLGSGEEAVEGKKVNIQWVLRKSDGYFVDSSKVNDSVPFIFTVGDKNAAIAGMNEGIQGMKVGGVRRLLIPPSLAYVDGVEDDKPGPVPQGFGPKQQMRRVMRFRKDVPGEYVFFEVQLTRVR